MRHRLTLTWARKPDSTYGTRTDESHVQPGCECGWQGTAQRPEQADALLVIKHEFRTHAMEADA